MLLARYPTASSPTQRRNTFPEDVSFSTIPWYIVPRPRSIDLHSVAGVNKALRTSHGQERVLFDAQIARAIKITAIPREMRMRIAETRHECPTFAVEDLHFVVAL